MLRDSYSDTISVDDKEGLAHVLVYVALEELLPEPNVEAVVVLRLQVVALAAKTVHSLKFSFFKVI
jgi:hypothetical protein